MKLFKRLAAALLAGGLALCMLAGCSEAPAVPQAPAAPSDPQELAVYQEIGKACEYYGYNLPAYNEELSAIAKEVAESNMEYEQNKKSYNANQSVQDEAKLKVRSISSLPGAIWCDTWTGKQTVKPGQTTAEDHYKAYARQLTKLKGANYVGVAVIDGGQDRNGNQIYYQCLIWVKA